MMKKWLKKLCNRIKPQNKTLSAKPFRNQRVLVIASNEIGIKEIQGPENNPQVVKYHSFARVDNDLAKGENDSISWCSSYVCYCLEVAGMESTNSKAARSFVNWGVSTKDDALPGDVVVFWRGERNGWKGHVGFYLGESSTFVYTLGGNQADSVNVSKYSKSRLLDIRRSSKHRKLDAGEQQALWYMADKIIAGGKVNLEGRMV